MSRKPNPWVQHVKEQAAKLNVSYPCAISLPEVKESYRKKAFEPLGKKPKKSKLKISKKDKLRMKSAEGPSLDEELENIEIQDKQQKRKKMVKDIKEELNKNKGSQIDNDIIQKVRSDPKALKQLYAVKNIAENIASKKIAKAFRNRSQRK